MTTPQTRSSDRSGDRSAVRRCPICRKPRDPVLSPFCSTRCRDRDLVNWLEGGYALPGPEIDPEGDPDRDV